MLSKKVLRDNMIKKLNVLEREDKLTIERGLHNLLLDSEEWLRAQTIGITLAHNYEWDTWPIIHSAWQQGKKVAIPKCYPNRHALNFFGFYPDSKLIEGHYKIREPLVEEAKEVNLKEIDLLIVPGLVFDQRNYRIGHGGGYYDRLLNQYRFNSISLAWKKQVMSTIPIESFDRAVDRVIIY